MRRGFTLIEIVLVLSIMSLIGGCSFVSIKYYKTLKNKVDSDYACNAVVSFINNSKMYCRENSCTAFISFDMTKKVMKLAYNMNVVKKLILSDKIISLEVIRRRENGDIVIDNYGFSNDAFTITIKDNNVKTHHITMKVDTGYVSIID